MSKKPAPSNPKKPGRKPRNLTVELRIKYVPLPGDRVAAWRASLALLVDWIVEDMLTKPDTVPSQEEK